MLQHTPGLTEDRISDQIKHWGILIPGGGGYGIDGKPGGRRRLGVGWGLVFSYRPTVDSWIRLAGVGGRRMRGACYSA